jgi:hypothetical protein
MARQVFTDKHGGSGTDCALVLDLKRYAMTIVDPAAIEKLRSLRPEGRGRDESLS